jgi:hypothetical protein
LRDGIALAIQLVQRVALRRQGAAMCFEPHAVKLGDGGNAARHPSEGAHVVCGQQQLHVAGAAAFR